MGTPVIGNLPTFHMARLASWTEFPCGRIHASKICINTECAIFCSWVCLYQEGVSNVLIVAKEIIKNILSNNGLEIIDMFD